MTTPDYIFIGITVAIYGLTFIYQTTRLKTLETILKSQADFVSNYEQYKKLLNDTLDLRLQKQKDELEASFRQQAVTIQAKTLESVRQTLLKETPKIMDAWHELSNIAIGVTLKDFPSKTDKPARDEYIKKFYPKNSDHFIRFIDDILDGKVKP